MVFTGIKRDGCTQRDIKQQQSAANMQFTFFFALVTSVVLAHDSSSSSSSSSPSSSKPPAHVAKDKIYLPKKGRFVVVKIKSNYAAYAGVCYRNGFKPATINRKSLDNALGALKEARIDRAWIRRYKPCRDCYFKQPKSISWNKSLGGRVELWKKDSTCDALTLHALCQKTRQQICKETGKCKKHHKKHHCRHVSISYSSSRSTSSSSSSSSSSHDNPKRKASDCKKPALQEKKAGIKKID